MWCDDCRSDECWWMTWSRGWDRLSDFWWVMKTTRACDRWRRRAAGNSSPRRVWNKDHRERQNLPLKWREDRNGKAVRAAYGNRPTPLIYHSQYRVVRGTLKSPERNTCIRLAPRPRWYPCRWINFTIARMGIPLAANIHYPWASHAWSPSLEARAGVQVTHSCDL